MSIELITVSMFGSMIVLMILGLPVAFSTGAVGVIFTAALGGPAALSLIPTRVFGIMTNFLLGAIPLFIVMATILANAGLIGEIYEMIHKWTGWLKGGVATATVIACTLLAMMVGIVGASEVTMGLIALPEMLKRRYDKYLACGAVLAGGTLGILIPPSIMLIVYGMVDNCSIGQLYAGAFLPGFLLAALYIGYITIRCYINPVLGPPIPKEERPSMAEKIRSLYPVIPSSVLIFLVLGSIVIGLASPTEAAGMGALGALLIAGYRRTLTWKGMVEACLQAMRTSSMVLWIMFGANIFVGLYLMVGGGDFIRRLFLETGLTRWQIQIFMQLTFIFLGCFMDWVGIFMLTIPLFGPIIRELGFDPIWFGVLVTLNMQISFLSPPFGYSLFFLKGVAPPEIATKDIWRGGVEFMILQLAGLALCMIFPEIILVVPRLFYR
jgi:tripartite ATP-independent transporter DctM subunit